MRIIAATHRNLQQLVNQGLFREDLFYRLNVVPIRLPPLRERIEDIPALVRHFLTQAAAEGLPLKTLAPAAFARLKEYNWPGNVREIENFVRRLAALYSEEVLELDVIEAEFSGLQPQAAPVPAEDEGLEAAVERHLKNCFGAQPGELPPGLYGKVLHEVEKPLLAYTLAATRGNQVRAAEILGLNRNTLRKKIRELDIPVVRGLK